MFLEGKEKSLKIKLWLLKKILSSQCLGHRFLRIRFFTTSQFSYFISPALSALSLLSNSLFWVEVSSMLALLILSQIFSTSSIFSGSLNFSIAAKLVTLVSL